MRRGFVSETGIGRCFPDTPAESPGGIIRMSGMFINVVTDVVE
jgi:hypothetical protein